MSTVTVRPEVMATKPYAPGLTIEEIKEKYGLDTVIKLASNENPLGTSPIVQKTVAKHAANIFRYPQNGNPRLNKAISEKIGVDEKCIISGNGSDEIIDLIIRVKAQPGRDEVITYESCFSMYSLMSRLCGIKFKQLQRNENFKQPVLEIARAATENTAAVFITSPDNPTGLAVSVDEIRQAAEIMPSETIFVVDEAYIDFASPAEKYNMIPLLREFPNLVLTRTFSKAYGLAGLRVGYGIMHEDLADYITRARAPFTVNLIAEEAAIAALNDDIFYNETLKVVKEGKLQVTKGLEKLGCKVLPSQSNFVMFTPPCSAQKLFEELLKKGVIVRYLKSFGYSDYIRVNMGTARENDVFLKQAAEIING
jgi:histidinol-phosphate aminotransferase